MEAPKSLSPPPPRLLLPLSLSSYLTSIPLLAFGVWLLVTRGYDCEELLRMPRARFAVGVGLLVLFLVSNFVVHYGDKVLLPGHLALAVSLAVMLVVGLMMAGAFGEEARGMAASPAWLKNRVGESYYWSRVKKCIYDGGVCGEFGRRTAESKKKKKMSTVESGCCKPPDFCNMEYVNSTYWKPAPNGDNTPPSGKFESITDCQTWSNGDGRLCYDCESCKEGYLKALTSGWKKIGLFQVVMSLLLFLIHAARFVTLMTARHV